MGIILPVNDRCRIEADSNQWIVMQRCRDDWTARTFWQDLAAAALDCRLLGLASREELEVFQPFVDRLGRATSRLSALAEGRETGDLDADLGSCWRVSAESNPETPRRHWLLTCHEPDKTDANRRETMGNYRRLDYALRQCLLMRLRQSGRFETLETIADEIAACFTMSTMAVAAAVTLL